MPRGLLLVFLTVLFLTSNALEDADVRSPQPVDGVSSDVAAIRDAVEAWERDVKTWHRDVVKLRGVDGRRLFDWTFGYGSSISSAANFITQASQEASSTVLSMQKAAELLKQAEGYTNTGIEIAKKAWASMLELAAQLVVVSEKFAPLSPIFSSLTGIVQLVASKNKLKQLLDAVGALTTTNTNLGSLHTSLSKLSETYDSLHGATKAIFDNLNSAAKSAGNLAKSRRLAQANLNDLLNGIDFEAGPKAVQNFFASTNATGNDLVFIDSVFRPLLEKLTAGSKTDAVARRLADSGGNVIANEQKYAEALKKFVPSWKVVETASFEFCPKVFQFKDALGVFGCRIGKFATDALLPNFAATASALGAITSGCPQLVESGGSVKAGCPAKVYSEGVKDVLGENADSLAWILAIAGAAGLLGGGGLLVACCKGKGGGDESSEEDHDESGDGEEGTSLNSS
eukprot:TRINITY_DN112211_c0_g1_i1.p1 TRINITY_DN112211_c0_g1~~TRINITY_DN112211_c0_g1_i1.p1  ORF type:complete len:456 (-),score=105.65 TRINITY_DN112211_c0_g1_i1:98-1465(-)